MCERMWLADLPPKEGLENDLSPAGSMSSCGSCSREQLFTFVTAKPADAAETRALTTTGGWDEQRGRANIAWRGPQRVPTGRTYKYR